MGVEQWSNGGTMYDSFKNKLTYSKINEGMYLPQDSFAHPTHAEHECCYFMYSDWDGVWARNWCDNRNNRVTHYACQYGKKYVMFTYLNIGYPRVDLKNGLNLIYRKLLFCVNNGPLTEIGLLCLPNMGPYLTKCTIIFAFHHMVLEHAKIPQNPKIELKFWTDRINVRDNAPIINS